MVWEADKNPFVVSLPSVSPRYEYDQSGITVAEVPALSPLSALPPESAQHPLTALVAVSTAVAPPEAESPPKQHVVPQA